jgi:hypothetical protein
MRKRYAAAGILLAALAYGKEPKPTHSGVLLQMDSVQCGYEEKEAPTAASEVLGTDATPKKTRALLCQEYVLQTDRVVFHIRPKDDKHAVLLPIGGIALFRLEKDKMVLRSEDLDDKDRDYNVISIVPREDYKATEATASKLNNR